MPACWFKRLLAKAPEASHPTWPLPSLSSYSHPLFPGFLPSAPALFLTPISSPFLIPPLPSFIPTLLSPHLSLLPSLHSLISECKYGLLTQRSCRYQMSRPVSVSYLTWLPQVEKEPEICIQSLSSLGKLRAMCSRDQSFPTVTCMPLWPP